jgi:hypothetical protein
MTPRLTQLDTLIKLRQAERDQRRLERAAAARSELALQAERDQVTAAVSEVQASTRRAATAGATDVQSLGEQERYRQVLRERLGELERRQQLLCQRSAELQQALLAAERELRILENLRAKRQVQAQTARRQSEAEQLREITLGRITDKTA